MLTSRVATTHMPLSASTQPHKSNGPPLFMLYYRRAERETSGVEVRQSVCVSVWGEAITAVLFNSPCLGGEDCFGAAQKPPARLVHPRAAHNIMTITFRKSPVHAHACSPHSIYSGGMCDARPLSSSSLCRKNMFWLY